MTRCFSVDNRRYTGSVSVIEMCHATLATSTCKGSLEDLHVISPCSSCQRPCCDARTIASRLLDMYSYSKPAYKSHAEAIYICSKCSNASLLWLHGCECCAYVLSFMPLQTCLHQGWTFFCARFLPNDNRIRFDLCKSLIWLFCW